MKFMKIGTRPDTFYTEEAVRYIYAYINTHTHTMLYQNCILLTFNYVPQLGL